MDARAWRERPPHMLFAAVEMKRRRLQSLILNDDIAFDPVRKWHANFIDMDRHASG